ncbi:hypothetical protein SCP_0702310 [Sparassis crispa]|uniref:Uncharacterized protein n=1 Tax=Sparassis crispa TaxID=139825 RepID=A0A401GS46_9APHY|nr:hypothetical protein SCP_0702310 [Sparassis crispa]GBE85045.1 hypothetical protein SCP_0702310 [Sparassis crispa]
MHDLSRAGGSSPLSTLPAEPTRTPLHVTERWLCTIRPENDRTRSRAEADYACCLQRGTTSSHNRRDASRKTTAAASRVETTTRAVRGPQPGEKAICGWLRVEQYAHANAEAVSLTRTS